MKTPACSTTDRLTYKCQAECPYAQNTCMHACMLTRTHAGSHAFTRACCFACMCPRAQACTVKRPGVWIQAHSHTHTHTRPPRQDRRPSCKRMNTCEHKLKHKEMNLLLPGSHLRAYVRCNRTITAVRANQVLLQTNVAHPRWISTAKTHDDHCNLPTNARLRH